MLAYARIDTCKLNSTEPQVKTVCAFKRPTSSLIFEADHAYHLHPKSQSSPQVSCSQAVVLLVAQIVILIPVEDPRGLPELVVRHSKLVRLC